MFFLVVLGGIVNSTSGHDPYRGYQNQTITVQREGRTFEQLCQRYRPTWKPSHCVDRLSEQNRNLNGDNLRSGDRIWIDKKLAGKDRKHIDYQTQTVTIGKGGQYRSFRTACNILRPTWELKACTKKIAAENPRLAPGEPVWEVTFPADI